MIPLDAYGLAARYGLDDLAQLCRDATKKLDYRSVMDLLNRDKPNLSAMDMRRGAYYSWDTMHTISNLISWDIIYTIVT